MPPLLLEVASLVTTRSVTNAIDADPYPSDPNGSSGHLGKAAIAGIVFGGVVAVALFGFLFFLVMYLGLLRPESEYFIFKRCCGSKRKHYGPLEEGYQPYDVFRSQGQHDTEAGFDKGFGNTAVSGASRTPVNRDF